tara:strand:- start:2010 stop:2333 length:324 start_codon:yes stop_codon:yes gene_type:complete
MIEIKFTNASEEIIIPVLCVNIPVLSDEGFTFQIDKETAMDIIVKQGKFNDDKWGQVVSEWKDDDDPYWLFYESDCEDGIEDLEGNMDRDFLFLVPESNQGTEWCRM